VARVLLPGEPLSDGLTSLRAWRDSDVSAIAAACQDPEIGRWTRVPSPYRETDARAFLLERYDAIHRRRSAPFAIVAPPSAEVQPDGPDDWRPVPGTLLGSIALMRPAWEHARAEVGYWLARDARGRGHATRAVRLICAWGFATLELERITLFAATGNLASQRVAERAGFRREALLRSYIRNRALRHDAVAYGLLASEAVSANGER
jgi:RimJ/RimL family protein N-acetyltransferase